MPAVRKTTAVTKARAAAGQAASTKPKAGTDTAEKPMKAATAKAVKPAAKDKPVSTVKTDARKALASPKAVAPDNKPAKAKAAKPAKEAAKDKPKKAKMVRDSFTMPEPEYKVLGEVKRACLKAGVEVKKSELLRVGVALLQKLKVEELRASIDTLAPVKAGRPKAK